MGINKFVVKVDGAQTEVIDFQSLVSGLSPGPHTLTVEAYNGAALIHSQTKNINVAGEGFDEDYQAVLDYATANSIAMPTPEQQIIDNQLLIDYKATGGWAKDDVFFKFKGTADPAFKLICWKRKIQGTAHGSLTWSVNGVKGNGTNAYIKSKYIQSTDAVNYSLSEAGVLATAFEVTTGGALVGSYQGSSDSYCMYAPKYDTSIGYYNFNDQLGVQTPTMQIGVNAAYRNSDTAIYAFGNSDINFVDSSGGTALLASIEQYILARNTSGSASNFSAGGLSFLTIGGSKFTIHNAVKTILI